MRRDQDIEAWRVFLAVHRAGSISGACDECQADASSISRTIQALEKSLGGVQLFNRASRPFRLTDNGRIALDYASEIVRLHKALLESVEVDFDKMSGHIRVGLPPILQIMMRDFFIDFTTKWPDVRLSILQYASAPPIRFEGADGRFDIISAYGPDNSNDNIVQIHYGDTHLIPCASPAYLARHGIPKVPSELVNHRGIIFGSRMRSGVAHMKKGDETQAVRFGQEIFFDSGYTAVGAAVGGAGIHPGIPTALCADEIAKGRLVPLLSEWRSPELHMYIYVRPELVKYKRVRVFIEAYRAWLKVATEASNELLRGHIPDDMLGVTHSH